MEINYLAILACGVFAMILGSVWFGPLFGKKWMELAGWGKMDPEARKNMKKSDMAPVYIIQFILVLIQAFTLNYYINGFGGFSVFEVMKHAVWICVGILLPTVAGIFMWTPDSRRVIMTKFFIWAGYQIILFAAFGLIIRLWS